MRSTADVLAVGAGGPIGSALRRIGGREGVAVSAVSRSDGVDVTDSASVGRLLARVGAPVVVYLVNDPALTPDESARSFADFVAAATAVGTRRVVFASSAAVYGADGHPPYREDARLDGASDYALSKIRSEAVLEAAAVSSAALRIFNVYGPGCRSSLVNRLVTGPPPELLMTDGFVRDYVHVDDVADAVLAAAKLSHVRGPINIGRGVGVGNLALAEAAGVDAFSPVLRQVRSVSVADVRRAEAALGWRARRDPLVDLARQRAATTRS